MRGKQIAATSLPEPDRPGPAASQRLLGKRSQLAVWPALVVLIGVGMVVSPAFLTARNITNVLQQASVLSVLVLAQLIVVLVRKFDLSTESTVAFAPMVAGLLLLTGPVTGIGLPEWSGFILTLFVGFVVGAVNAVLIVRLQLNAFIASLAMLILLRGATLGLSTGQTLYQPPVAMVWPGSVEIGGIPVSIIISATLYALFWFVLKHTAPGRSLYAIGGNPTAATAAGIDVARVTVIVLIIASVMSAFAGLMLSGRIESITANQGESLIFYVIAALAIGSVSLNGGRGTVMGALSGVLFLSILANILILAGLDSFWVDMTRGAIIVVALIIARLTGGPSDE